MMIPIVIQCLFSWTWIRYRHMPTFEQPTHPVAQPVSIDRDLVLCGVEKLSKVVTSDTLHITVCTLHSLYRC